MIKKHKYLFLRVPKDFSKCSERFSEKFREIFQNVPRDFPKCSERFLSIFRSFFSLQELLQLTDYSWHSYPKLRGALTMQLIATISLTLQKTKLYNLFSTRDMAKNNKQSWR